MDLSTYQWRLTGYTPHSWKIGRTLEEDIEVTPEVAAVPVHVPGSVHGALLQAGHLPDWNVGLNARACEWVDHRDWIYSVDIPRTDFAKGRPRRLRCLGLDGFGRVLFNRQTVGTFRNGFVPHDFDLSQVELQDTNTIEIIFDDLPRYIGTPCFSSEIHDFKARFNYTWDWMPRNVQTGIWDSVTIACDGDIDTEGVTIRTGYDAEQSSGELRLRVPKAEGIQTLRLTVEGVVEQTFGADTLADGVTLEGLAVRPWFCNGLGEQMLYSFSIQWLDSDGEVRASREDRVGFKHVDWRLCEPSPQGADPWICVLNGQDVFQVGVNWTPIRAHYADVTEADYRERLETYRGIGFNVLRVWGGAFLEKDIFYRLCDELGFLVWQEFPLSSSGPDNQPPQRPDTIRVLCDTARSYIRRRRHHVSLLLWSGGNELMTAMDGSRGGGLPLGIEHPTLAALGKVCSEQDPDRRYIPTSPSGPRFRADAEAFGQGLHWDVHGPWKMPGATRAEAQAYWDRDDALFRSETGAPGCSSIDILKKYYPGCDLLPVSTENPYWRRTFAWIDEKNYVADHGHVPESIEDYARWSQAHQAEALIMALDSALRRFPAIGGFILWMGHDSFPCPANTSILDFHGKPKPAALAIRDRLSRYWEESRVSSTV